MKKIAALAICLSLSFGLIAAEKKNTLPKPEPGQKIVPAVRAEAPIVVDGLLTESVWKGDAVNGFTQNDPNDGQPATEKTDVWVAYDDQALYVAAFCHDSEPDKISGRVGRRDASLDSDWFMVAVDPYYDKRSGYLFCINPAGSIMDYALSNDVAEDSSWDGVWKSKVRKTEDGWMVEMRIPYNQIRFPKQDEYVWGVNFRRVVMRKNEVSSFSWVPKNEPAFVSRFARLEGIRGISPGRHIEVVPYTVGQGRFRPAESGNPFETGSSFLGNAGFDMKVGLKGNLTLDATVNPDFGQVEVDPAVLNLSAYESYFQEKRPFFIEGSSLFNGFGRGGIYLNVGMNWPNPRLFYSRRIGREPQGYVTQPGFVDYPDRSTILGAAKVTGKLGGWNVGFINSLTAREYAVIDNLGIRSKEAVEPFSYYGAFRAQKEIAQGRHGFGVMATGVMRDLDGNPDLSGIMNRNAFSLALDGWSFLDEKRTYVVGGWIGGTRVAGSPLDILRLQYSPTHYFQRPDAGHVAIDSEATSLAGWGGRVQIAKQSGNFLWVVGLGALSPGFNPNDAGFQPSGSDVINISFLPGYMWTKPGKVFQQALVAMGGLRNYDFGGNKVAEAAVFVGQGVFRNFWNFNLEVVGFTRTLSNRLTRGGPLAATPAGYQVVFTLGTDSRKNFVLETSSSLSGDGQDGAGWSLGGALRWKPSSNASLSIGPRYIKDRSEMQWVTSVGDSLMADTYGRRYIFGRIEQDIVSADIRLDWSLNPRLSIQAYLQPFIAVGRYDRFKELARPKEFAYNLFGDSNSTISLANGRYAVDPDGPGPAAPFAFGNPNFNVKSLRGTVVMRWEYLPGSLLYLVWTQNRADYADPGNLRLGRDIGNLLTAPGDNIFMFKLTFRWNM
ncbi:MAG: carbohydrate binding family 9 domain-containing protein [Acidobacteria bacterium]|nr:carbohydrate binding family 9 domain-containing protein [Acidobacteriota bacterium]